MGSDIGICAIIKVFQSSQYKEAANLAKKGEKVISNDETDIPHPQKGNLGDK